MAERKCKCYGNCGEKYLKKDLTQYSNKNYCHSCYEKVVKENEDRVTLYNMIKDNYKVTFPTLMHLAQIKRCKEEGYSYEDMIKAMNYCISILKLSFGPNMGFGWISNHMEEAKEFYRKEAERTKSMFENYNNTTEDKKVLINKIDNTNTFKESKMIRLEDIL